VKESSPRQAGLFGFAENIADWIREVGVRAPGYARVVDELLGLLAGHGEPSDAVRGALEADWGERSFDASYDRPLLLFAALRDDALHSGPDHPLWEVLGADAVLPHTVTRDRVAAALAPERARVHASLRRRSVQTNETSRAVAWLWPAHLVGAGAETSGVARPIALVDVGASAGLNLLADRLPAIWKDDRGGDLPVARDPQVRLRLGIDKHPLDALDPETALWLEACIWAGELDRIARLRAGIDALRAARERGDAPELVGAEARAVPSIVAERTRALPPGTLVLAYQTMSIEYFPPEERAAYGAGMRSWLASAPNGCWLELERDAAGDRSWPAAIRRDLRERRRDRARAASRAAATTRGLVLPDADGIRPFRAWGAGNR
jgi:hypothetical protein